MPRASVNYSCSLRYNPWAIKIIIKVVKLSGHRTVDLILTLTNTFLLGKQGSRGAFENYIFEFTFFHKGADMEHGTAQADVSIVTSYYLLLTGEASHCCIASRTLVCVSLVQIRCSHREEQQ